MFGYTKRQALFWDPYVSVSWTSGTWDNFRDDVRYTFRRLARDARFAAAAIMIIAVGIGANTAMFSIANALLFRPLPFEAAERLVWVANTGKADLSSQTTRVSNYTDWKRLNHSFEDMAAYFAFFDYGTYNMVGAGEPERLVGVGVSRDFLSFLGVRLALGRNFTDEEAKWNGTPAVILTDGLWQRRFGADRSIIGRSITLNDRATTVVGVLPASFDFGGVFTPGSRIDLIVPFPITQETDRWGNTLAVIGRLKPGVTIQQAQAEFDVLSEQIMKSNGDKWPFGARMTLLQEHLTGRFRRGLILLLCAVGAVLLIGCTNLSNLLLARAASRRKEMAIRSALGARRARLIGQLLTESFALSICGAVVGLGFAYAAVRFVASIRAVSISLLNTVAIDAKALLFTAAAALGTTLLFGVVPAFQTSGSTDAESLKDAGRGLSESRATTWTRSALVVSEVALACVLLVGAGLLIRSFLHVLDVDLGFRPERAAVWRIETGDRYKTNRDQAAFFDRLVRAVETVPGAEAAGVTDALPLSRDRSWGVGARGAIYAAGEMPIAHPRLVDWRYIRTMGIPLLAGREFGPQDTADSEKVLIINEKAARRLWPGQNAVGQMARINRDERRVVGVVGNVRHLALEQEGGLEMYLPIAQTGINSVELVVRTKLAPESLASGIRGALRSVDPTLPTAEFHALGELVDKAVSPRRFVMLLLGGFAASALLLACIGIYGVISYNVSQRTPEIGVRMALGASGGHIQRQILLQTLALAGYGALIGVAGALALGRFAASMLYNVKPTDPVTFMVTVGSLSAVALLAAYGPAARAARIDPMVALRTE